MLTRFRVLALILVASACALHAPSFETAVVAGPPERSDAAAATPIVRLWDQISVVTRVRAHDDDDVVGAHSVRWRWYDGDELIADRSRTLDVKHNPDRIQTAMSAADLGVGHYRVLVSIDGRDAGTQSFEVVGR